MATIAQTEPATLTAGDRWRWQRDLSDYPAGTWTLTYALRNANSAIDITAGASGTTHDIDESAATTADYAPGDYVWQAYVSDGTSRYQVGSGRVTVAVNFAAAGVTDGRSHARVMLDYIEARLEGRASTEALDTLSYSIAGRSLSRMSLADLLPLRDKYRAEVQREEQAERVARGLESGRQIRVRF